MSTVDIWKKRVVQFLKLKSSGITFQASNYDFLYSQEKHSVGLITDQHGDQIYSVSFFKSLNNENSFYDVVRLDKDRDVIIPRFESLLKIGHKYMKKTSHNYKTSEFKIVSGIPQETGSYKYQLYGRMNIQYKTSGDVDDYDNMLDLIVRLIREDQSRLSGRA